MPIKAIANSWPKEIQTSCYLLSYTFKYGDQWIHGSAFYGPAKGAEIAAVRAEADNMLSYVTQQLVYGLQGKRFILGDFNQLHGQLPQTEIWTKQGWREIQDLEMCRTGEQPQNTCKTSTRKDIGWICPELQAFWESTLVENLAFKDHAVLCARFKPFGKPEKITLWRKSKPIPWNKPKGDMPVGTFAFSAEKADKFCLDLAQEFEQRAHTMSLRSTGQPACVPERTLCYQFHWSQNPRACSSRADKETFSRNSMAPMSLIKDGLSNWGG